jgi:heptosyltransferase-1
VLSSGPTVAVVAGGGSNPGNRIAAKNWKPEGFAGVITKLVVEHDAVIVLCGKGEEDAAIAKSVIAMSRCASDRRQHESRIVNLVNKTSLKQAAALFQRCEVVLTNDTSLMHLAAAVGAPMVSIFGPTDPANLAPRGSMHRTIATSLPCAPCYGYNGYRSCDAACMDEIGWESVYREVVALLKTGRKSRHGSENAHCR